MASVMKLGPAIMRKAPSSISSAGTSPLARVFCTHPEQDRNSLYAHQAGAEHRGEDTY